MWENDRAAHLALQYVRRSGPVGRITLREWRNRSALALLGHIFHGRGNVQAYRSIDSPADTADRGARAVKEFCPSAIAWLGVS
jgi:hypothetical protein